MNKNILRKYWKTSIPALSYAIASLTASIWVTPGFTLTTQAAEPDSPAPDLPILKEISPATLEEAEGYSADILEAYRQEKYKLDDPAGDYALLKRSELVPPRAFAALTGTKEKPRQYKIIREEDYEITREYTSTEAPQALSEREILEDYRLRNPREAELFGSVYRRLELKSEIDAEKLKMVLENAAKPIQGRESPLLREGFGKMFAQIINEETANGINPIYGQPHAWSPEFLAKYGQSSPMLATSKLLMALATGDTFRFMRTDQEEPLYKWMIAHPKSSVTIPELFRQSYRLNGGDVYKTLLTIENVLSRQWKNPNRERLPLTERLKPITSGHQYSGDKFGTWYHLFGIMLYGYVKGSVKGTAIGAIEALGAALWYPTEKTQKRKINLDGGSIGSDLADQVKQRTFSSVPLDPALLAENSYLNRNEDFRDRIHVPLSPEVDARLEKQADRSFVHIRHPGKALKGCKVELMSDVGLGFNSSNKDTAANVNIGESLVTLQIFTPQVRKVRGFIQCENLDETLAFEAE